MMKFLSRESVYCFKFVAKRREESEYSEDQKY